MSLMLRLIGSLLAAFALFPQPCSAQTGLDKQVDSLFAAWNSNDTPGVAVAVVEADEVVYRRGFGMANLDYDVPITPSTVFLVASVSKQFTAFAIAMLAIEGIINLNDPVTKYVPELPEFQITVRHLVHHTSGLRDAFGLLAMAGYHMDDVITKKSILDLLYRQEKLNFDPGEEYLYSNSGYILMAEIVERVTGMSFADWTQKHLFEPLGMKNSHFRDDHREVLPNRAQGYVTRDDGYAEQVVAWSSVGASGLYTTATDLARWATNFSTGAVGGPRVLDLVHQRGRLANGDTLAYAFGLTIGSYRGFQTVGHGGSHRSFRTHFLRLPEEDLAIIVLSNLEEFDPADMARKIVDVYLEEDPTMLSQYVGTYYSEELDATYTIALEATHLVARHRRYEDIHLMRSDKDHFSSDSWFLPSVEFSRDAHGITGFEVTNRRTRKVWFAKR